jgi:hypothetical protein
MKGYNRDMNFFEGSTPIECDNVEKPSQEGPRSIKKDDAYYNKSEVKEKVLGYVRKPD